MDSKTIRPHVLAWTTLDLHLVDDAWNKIDEHQPDFDAVEQFCRELRQARANWQFFQAMAAIPEYVGAAEWLISRSTEVLSMIADKQGGGSDGNTWAQVRKGIERHREILRSALAQLAEAA
jgi:hypothetical protein